MRPGRCNLRRTEPTSVYQTQWNIQIVVLWSWMPESFLMAGVPIFISNLKESL
jgi:hypothetical protein